MMKITAIICAYNAARRLPACLHALAQTTLAADQWEVLVVDNASSDDTSHVAIREWRRKDVSLSVVMEPKLGLVYARHKGVLSSNGEILVFVDDDNLLSPSYLESVRDAFIRDSDLVVFGGRGIAAFESPPPSWVGSNPKYLGVGPQGGRTGYIPLKRGYVYGACSAFRKADIAKIYRYVEALECTGRSGMALTAGDDVEVCLLLLATGGKAYYDGDATFEHRIESRRLSWDYQLRLFEGFGHANSWLGLLRRQIRRDEGLHASVRASIYYTIAQAFVMTTLDFAFRFIPWSRLPEAPRTLQFRAFASMCKAVRRRKSSFALHKKAVELVNRVRSDIA